jgi:hypothetical protein
VAAQTHGFAQGLGLTLQRIPHALKGEMDLGLPEGVELLGEPVPAHHPGNRSQCSLPLASPATRIEASLRRARAVIAASATKIS